ncbi:MAG: DUF4198 domain-containing protein [Bryobacteraceae bacterium]|nr:DUF4198 domain-containing protein [Bryobacteraceae bacterium]
MKTAILLVLPVSAFAHDLYLMPGSFQVKPGERIAIALHVGDSFPESEGPMDPARIRDARLSDGTPIGDFAIVGKITLGYAKPMNQGSLSASLSSAPRFLQLAPAKFEEYLREEGLDQVIAWRRENGETLRPGRELYSKFAKTLLVSGSPSAEFARPAGLLFEFVPEADPAGLKPGDRLPVRLLFRGSPAAGVQVQVANQSGKTVIAGRTGDDGRIAIPLSRSGHWRLHAVAMERAGNKQQADWESFWASLTFAVP